MKAVILTEPGTLDLVDVPAPDRLGPDDVLVAPRRVGLCGTDYHAFAGRQNFFTYPRILGHEIAVEVLAVGDEVTHVGVGDQCPVLPYVDCGTCSACIRGRTNCCERIDVLGVTTDGALREQFVVPARTLFDGRGLGVDALALVETLGIGLHAVERSGVERDEYALIVGAGPIGLAIAQSARVRGTRIVMTDNNPARLDAAKALLSVETVLNDGDIDDPLRDLGSGELPTTVFEATGNALSMQAAAHFVNATGSLVLVGHTAGPLTFDNPLLHRREMTILASRNALATEWPTLIDAVADGQLDALPWINRRMALDEVPADFAGWASPDSGVLKGVVEIGDTGLSTDWDER